MILEKIFFIEIVGSPSQSAHLFMGRSGDEYFVRVQTTCNKISPFFFNRISRDIYDEAKDWFYQYYDGFLEVTVLDEASFCREAKNFVNTIEE